MHAIYESEWGQAAVFTWGELTPHQWECFRLALLQSETELKTQGVTVAFSGATHEVITELQTHEVKVVLSPIIVQTTTEMITNMVVSTRDYITDMVRYLPVYERKSPVFIVVLTAYDREFRNTEQQLEIVNRNIFLDTAIETLYIYERDLGIRTINSLRYDQRREQISSRYRASFDQTTEETIKSVAAAYSNGDVEINKTDVPGVYEIKFVSMKGIPNNMAGLMQALDIVLPAHLAFEYTYTYNPWDFLKDQTWGGVRRFTWDELRVWDEVI